MSRLLADPTVEPRPPVALYVHVPFCLSVCPYCDFVVYGGRTARGPGNAVAALVDALVVEIGLRAAATAAEFEPCRPALRSVYLGGGTPSLLAPAAVERLLAAADAGFRLAGDAEVTLEVNPGSDDRGDLAGFLAAGVTRLSVGAQSMDGAELRALGRRHRPEDVVSTIAEARRAGFGNVGLDLLYDVPGQTLGSWRRTLEAVLALEPEHVSAYALDLADPDAEGLTGPLGDHLPLRPGARLWRERAASGQDEDRAAACYLLAERRLSEAGLRWYEISNWSVARRESRHNLAYWRREAHEAVGPGAHAFDGALTRRWNAADLGRYICALLPSGGAKPSLPPGASDTVDPVTAAAEAAILRLRLAEGLPADLARRAEFAQAVEWARRQRLVDRSPDGAARLTVRGRLLGGELFARLLPAPAAAA